MCYSKLALVWVLLLIFIVLLSRCSANNNYSGTIVQKRFIPAHHESKNYWYKGSHLYNNKGYDDQWQLIIRLRNGQEVICDKGKAFFDQHLKGEDIICW